MKATSGRHLRVSVAVLGVLLAGSVVLTVWVRDLVANQEDRLLRERGAAAGLVLQSAILNLDPQLGQLGIAARMADVAPGAFAEVAAGQSATNPTLRVSALVRPTAEGFKVDLVAGPALSEGQVLDGARAAAVERAARGGRVVSTSVFTDGPDLVLGFALGSPSAPPGTVLYREGRILPGSATRSTSSAPFAELMGELYAGPVAEASQLVLATAERPAADDNVFEQKLPVGDSEWLFIAAAKRPLAGPLMARLPWMAGAAAVAGSLLLAAMVEALTRRRDYALALVDSRTAELRDSLASLELARQEAATARDQAMDASRMKSQFLANMSHEIRTPLNGMIGMTGLLIDTPLDAEQREFAKTARRSGEILLELVNDVLDFSKIEAGKLELETSDFDLGAVVEDVAELFAAAAQRKGLEITCSSMADVPRAVAGDPGRVRQVLTNLVGNAVKFTDSGEVAITVSAERRDEQLRVRFSVRDTGMGIGEADQQRLFEAFTQADASTTRRYGGTGLGLAISKRLTEMMGGDLGLESRPGNGSTFWFEVPLVAVTGTDDAPIDTTALARRRVLIVDDNATSRAVLQRQLESWGVDAESAADGATGLRAIRKAFRYGRGFDAVLLDYDMPGMDGPDVLGVVAVDESMSTVKVLMLTPVASVPLGDARIAACLTKPVRPAQLVDSLVAVLAEAPEGPRTAPPASKPVDTWVAPPGLRVLVAEDNPVNQRVVAAMLGRLGFRVDVVGDGCEAVTAFTQLPYDAVLMDCQMPGMSGYDATAEIRRREAGGWRVPILALTASAMKGDEERCLAAGMDAYLSKPVRMDDLAETLRSLIGQVDRPGPAEAADPGPIPGDQQREVLENETVEGLRALGGDVLLEIASDFRRGVPDDISELKRGIADADLERVGRAAHRLKGGCLALGATRMGALATEIEYHALGCRLDQAAGRVEELESSYDDVVAVLEAAV